MERKNTARIRLFASELRKDCDIERVGAEKVGSVHAMRIALTPQSSEVRKNYAAKIELWIPGRPG